MVEKRNDNQTDRRPMDQPAEATQTPPAVENGTDRPLSAAARRALAEAEARRLHSAVCSSPAGKEVDGREGPEPIRYGDWEVGGIATDF
jgi:hypothetical protein